MDDGTPDDRPLEDSPLMGLTLGEVVKGALGAIGTGEPGGNDVPASAPGTPLPGICRFPAGLPVGLIPSPGWSLVEVVCKPRRPRGEPSAGLNVDWPALSPLPGMPRLPVGSAPTLG